jgi:hypothetical protein
MHNDGFVLHVDSGRATLRRGHEEYVPIDSTWVWQHCMKFFLTLTGPKRHFISARVVCVNADGEAIVRLTTRHRSGLRNLLLEFRMK